MRKRIVLILAVAAAVAVWAASVFLKSAYVFPVAMYHSIDHKDGVTKLSVSPESFEKQMKFLHDNNYNVVTAGETARYIEGKEPIPPKTVAITFDDGFKNNYKRAYPILKKYGIPATMFVIVNKIGNKGFMSWDEIREMSDSGLVTIGSHTMSHKWLPSLDDDAIRRELTGSKAELERGTGRKVESLAYPVGAFDERVKRIAKEAGYKCAFATNPGPAYPSDDIYAIKRIRISRTSNAFPVFWFETSGYYTWVKEHRDD